VFMSKKNKAQNKSIFIRIDNNQKNRQVRPDFMRRYLLIKAFLFAVTKEVFL
jgi:hypothetical protein